MLCKGDVMRERLFENYQSLKKTLILILVKKDCGHKQRPSYSSILNFEVSELKSKELVVRETCYLKQLCFF